MMVLTGCAQLNLKPVQNPKAAWHINQHKLRKIACFKAAGQVGVSENGKANSANVTWVQRQNHYQIELSGPLGVDASTLSNAHGKVMLKTPKKTVYAPTPEVLLQNELGLSLPVSGLVDWIRGLPVSAAAPVILNQYGYIKSLSETGWHIQYLQYQNINGVGLPKQMLLRHAGIRVVVAIGQWQLPNCKA